MINTLRVLQIVVCMAFGLVAGAAFSYTSEAREHEIREQAELELMIDFSIGAIAEIKI